MLPGGTFLCRHPSVPALIILSKTIPRRCFLLAPKSNGITNGFEVPQRSEIVILGTGEHAEGLQQCLQETPRQQICPIQAPVCYLPLQAASTHIFPTAAQGSMHITTHLQPERAKSEAGTTPQPLHKKTTFSCHKQKRKKKKDFKRKDPLLLIAAGWPLLSKGAASKQPRAPVCRAALSSASTKSTSVWSASIRDKFKLMRSKVSRQGFASIWLNRCKRASTCVDGEVSVCVENSTAARQFAPKPALVNSKDFSCEDAKFAACVIIVIIFQCSPQSF